MSEGTAIATGFTVPAGTETAAPVMPARTVAVAAADLIRPCTPADLPQVAMLFQHTFRKREGDPPQELIAHLEDVYFRHPWRDPALPSLVLERADGALDGFIGVIPLRLEFRGQPLLGSVAGAFMIRDAEQRPMAAARLMRSHISGPQQVSFGDTTNGAAQTMWERLGGQFLPLASMEWLKILRLVPFGAAAAAGRMPSVLRIVGGPIATAIDRVDWAMRSKPQLNGKAWSAETVGDDAYLAAVDLVSASFELRLQPDRAAGLWLLAMAAQKRQHGELHRRVVTGRAGKPIGTYLVYCRRGTPAVTLQVVTSQRHAHDVVESLFAFAAAEGCPAVRGRTQGPLMNPLFQAGCIMRHRSATVVRSANTELIRALESAHIGLGGFYGETWTRLVSDEFGGHH